jgi:hypothetical protein
MISTKKWEKCFDFNNINIETEKRRSRETEKRGDDGKMTERRRDGETKGLRDDRKMKKEPVETLHATSW